MARYIRIADELMALSAEGTAARLPSIHELSIRFKAAPATVFRALHLLADRGRIRLRKGKCAVIIDKNGQEMPESTACDAIYASIKADISKGSYRSGYPLPKFGFFLAQYHIASGTLHAALRKLSLEKIIHKSGKRWVVGPGSPRTFLHRASAIPPPAVMLLVRTKSDWRDFFNNTHTAAFAQSFNQEMVRFGIQMRIGLLDHFPDPSNTPGEDEIRYGDLVRTLKDHYQGTMIIANDLSGRELDTAYEQLARFDKPVVFFDAANRGAILSHRRPMRRCKFVRLFFDEQQAVELALAYLTANNHARIAVPRRFPPVDWMERRCALLQAAAQRLSPGPELLFAQLTEPFWNLRDVPAGEDLFSAYEKNVRKILRAGNKRECRTLLIEKTPSMRGFLDRRATALIGLNDRLAQEEYFWLRLAGIAVPDTLSMVSFDNIPESIAMPISTMDFGFGQLGYLAAHIFIGDIPSAVDRRGSIAGPCTLIDRGSAGHGPGNSSDHH